ncbi:glycosyltransferase [soil metagenome]
MRQELEATLGVVASIGEAVVRRGITRPAERLLERDHWARPLDFDRDRVVLLFYEDFDRDRWVRGDRHLVRAARSLVRAARHKQKTTGFRVAYEALVRALEETGYVVVENDHALARANPRYPVGVAGYTHVLDRFTGPNPVVLGPGLLDHPKLRPDLMNDARYVRYIVPCAWMLDLFEKTYRNRCGLWFAGIDTAEWPDLSRAKKDLDFIVYDKVQHDVEAVRAGLVTPIEAELDRRGLSWERLRYKHYDHAQYRELLARARGLVFLSENETQGIAYQEALSTNVPVLAWDSGFWHDPVRFQLGEDVVPASSVPYFEDGVTGERFRDLAAFDATLTRFVSHRASYTPRRYVEEHLSLAASAQAYIELYRSAMRT